MKILFVPSWYPNKKNPISGNFVKEIAKALSLYDDVIVIHASPDKSSGFYDDVEEGVRVIRVKFRNFPFLTHFQYLISLFRAFRKVRREMEHIDIINAHVYYPAGLAALIFGKIYKIPVVITEHAEIIDEYKGDRFKLFKDILRKMIAKFVFKRVNLIIAVSNSLREHIKSYGIENKYAVVPNVINIDFFKRGREEYFERMEGSKGRENNTKRIIFIGGLTPRKGVPYLLEALRIIKSKGNFLLHIIGDGPFKEGYMKIAKDLGINDTVIFHGKVSDEDKLRLLMESDFMVLPSLYESFGVVLLEAMACGKPVITTLSGGQKEFVNENTGILVHSGDANELADAIEYMLEHCDEYSPHKIYAYVEERFSYRAVGKRLHEVYASLMENIDCWDECGE